MMETLHQALHRRYACSPTALPFTYSGITAEEALALPVIGLVHEWAQHPFAEEPTWPVRGVPIPRVHDVGEASHIYEGSYVTDEWILACFSIFEAANRFRKHWRITAYPRQPDSAYWPDETTCAAEVGQWAVRLFEALQSTAGEDPEADPLDSDKLANHWLFADRRYGLKNNQTCRTLWLAHLDPEARHRKNPSYPLPRHMELHLRYADFLCGMRANVGLHNILPDKLNGSGCTLDNQEVLQTCRSWYAQGRGCAARLTAPPPPTLVSPAWPSPKP